MFPIQTTRLLGPQDENHEIEGLLDAMNQLNFTEGTMITFDHEDQIIMEGKTIRLVPGWKWVGEKEGCEK